MADTKRPPPARRRAKSGPLRLLLQWSFTDFNPVILLLVAVSCVGAVIYAQQVALVSIFFAAGLLLSPYTWGRVGAVLDIAAVWSATAGNFWKMYAWNDETGDWAWRLEHGPVAAGVGLAAGVVVGAAFLWLFGSVGEVEEDGDDEEEPPPSVVEATRAAAADPERTVDQEPAAPESAAPQAYGDVGGHEILAEVGRGGMGVVFKARRRDTGRVVALKMTLAKAGAAVKAVERFRGEAEAVAKVDHPGIVPIYEFGDHHGRQFFTMGFVDGPSLSARLSAGPLEPAVAAYVVRQAAEAVAAAHAQGIVHRDLKPGNILLDRGGDTRVTDFGLARRVDAADRDDADAGPADDGAEEYADTMMTVQRLTATGAVMGTPAYMAPEQALDAKRVGPAADVWGLGAVLYACLTGRPPFHGASMAETLTLVIEADPRPPREMAPLVDSDLEAICLKCLRKDPADRYKTAAELAADLAKWEAGKTPVAARVGVFERLRRLDAAYPEGLPVLTGLVASRVAGLQDSIFAAAVVAGTFIVRHVPRPQALARSATLWGLLAVVLTAAGRTEYHPFPESERANLISSRDRTPKDQLRERAEWDRYIAARDADAAERIARQRAVVVACALVGAVFGAGLAVGFRSVSLSAAGHSKIVLAYWAAVILPAVAGALGLFFEIGNTALSRNGRPVMKLVMAPAGWAFAAAAGLAAGTLIFGTVRRLAGPTRTGAKSAAFAARLGMAAAAVGMLWAATFWPPTAAKAWPAVEDLFGRGPLSNAVESWLTESPDQAGDSLRPAVMLAKFLVLAAPLAAAAVSLAVLLRGRKFR